MCVLICFAVFYFTGSSSTSRFPVEEFALNCNRVACFVFVVLRFSLIAEFRFGFVLSLRSSPPPSQLLGSDSPSLVLVKFCWV